MDILFWSGGKDSYLAYEFYRKSDQRDNDSGLALLTTYNATTGTVPHQDIPFQRIKKQAEFLGNDLIGVPLEDNASNQSYLASIKNILRSHKQTIDHLVFGDWHLEDIRRWREERFGEMGYNCQFPIWHKTLHELLPVLQLLPVTVTISSVQKEYKHLIRVGESYDQQFIRTLPDGIDPMGEKGEFHTEVTFNAYGN